MHFFKFKLNSNAICQSIVLYTTYKLIKNNYQKIYNSKKQIKINFKHKKLNYEKWCMNLVMVFQSYIFKNQNIINFKHKKSNYFQNNRKNYIKSKSTHSSKSIIQKIAIESTINIKYQNFILKINKI